MASSNPFVLLFADPICEKLVSKKVWQLALIKQD
jgi:hypothetical protein